MIGIWSGHADTFLRALAVIVCFGAGLPILFTPLVWAAWIGWDIPQPRALVVYLARCLGAFILVLCWLMLRAAAAPVSQPLVFEIMVILWAAMLLIHVWGALQGAQPLTETLEIFVWLGVILLTLAFWPDITEFPAELISIRDRDQRPDEDRRRHVSDRPPPQQFSPVICAQMHVIGLKRGLLFD